MIVPFQRGGGWNADEIARPWDAARPALYAWLSENFDPEQGRIPPDRMMLPDTPPMEPGQMFCFSPGAEQHILKHHVAPGETADDYFFALIERTLQTGDPETFSTLYDAIVNSGQTLDLLREDYSVWETEGVQPPVFIQRLAGSGLEKRHLASLAHLLATEAPDSEAASFALALLRVFPAGDAADIAHVFGRHDTFTTEAIAVIKAVSENPEDAIWALARQVYGWGRVYCVHELAATERDDIAEWLLLEGHLTEALPSNVTGVCARVGKLAERLSGDTVDRAVFEAAGRIIAESFDDGEYLDMNAWDDGEEIADRYTYHAAAHCVTVPLLNDLFVFCDVLCKGAGWSSVWIGVDEDITARYYLEKRPWNEAIRAPMIARIKAVAAQPGWPEKLRAYSAVSQLYPGDLRETAMTAKRLGIDVFGEVAARVERGEDLWHILFDSDDGTRTDRILAMADRLLPLREIAALPRDAERSEENYALFSGLWAVIGCVMDFPGKGWKFVHLGLTGMHENCRRTVVHVLHAWGEAHWPVDARLALERAAKIEEIPDIRDMMRRALDGKPLFEMPVCDPPDFDPEGDLI